MKKLIIASAVALSLASVASHAANGTVNFTGTVTAPTCDIVVGGPASGGSNTIDLGSVIVDGDGTAKDFVLKASPTVSCTGHTGDVEVSWQTAAMSEKGVVSTGTATDAFASLTAVNSKKPNQPINSTNNAVLFSGDDLKSDTGAGLQFKAQLHGGKVAGAYQSTISYMVAYK
ncbi:fimbrial protein [Salmonella enterica subsp. enterica serovar Braenderup]